MKTLEKMKISSGWTAIIFAVAASLSCGLTSGEAYLWSLAIMVIASVYAGALSKDDMGEKGSAALLLCLFIAYIYYGFKVMTHEEVIIGLFHLGIAGIFAGVGMFLRMAFSRPVERPRGATPNRKQ